MALPWALMRSGLQPFQNLETQMAESVAPGGNAAGLQPLACSGMGPRDLSASQPGGHVLLERLGGAAGGGDGVLAFTGVEDAAAAVDEQAAIGGHAGIEHGL